MGEVCARFRLEDDTDPRDDRAMATDRSYIEYICEQANLGADLSYRKMFGEYALYLHGKVVALVCDNQLFVKPTGAGRQILGTVAEHPPYPGARLHFRVDDELDDPQALQRLLLTTAHALPPAKPKTVKRKRKAKSRGGVKGRR